MAQKNFMIKNGLRVGDSDLFVTSGGTTVKGLTVGNVSIPSTIGSDNQILKVVSGSLAFASTDAGMEDSDLTKVANLQNKVDGLINRLDSDDAERQIGTLIVDSDGQILLNTNDDVANSGTLTIDSDGQILFLTGNDTLDSVGSAILSLRADRDSDSSKLAKISEITNKLDSDSAAIQLLATKTRADLDSDSIILQQLRTAVNTNTANIASSGGIDSDHVFQAITVENNAAGTNLLSLQTTDNGSSAGPELNLNRVSDSPADADYLGQIKFRGKHDGGGTINYAKITGKIDDATQATSTGLLEFMIRKDGSNNINARLKNDKLDLINGTGLDVAGDVTVDTNVLKVDTTNNKVGVGTADPSNKFEVDGGSAETRLRVSTTGTDANEAGIILANSSKSADNDGIEIAHGAGYTTFRGLTGTEYMKITGGTGIITKPLQPAFQVHPASQQNNLTVNAYTTIAFGTERFDNNSDFASNTFTAPVTGKYQLNLFIYFLSIDIDANYWQINLETSNQTYYQVIVPKFTSDLAYHNFSMSVLADFDANDTSYVRIYQAGGDAQTDIAVATTFSGYLVC